MFETLMWYPWLKSVIKSIFNGEIRDRLSLQADNHNTISIVLNGPSVNKTIKYLNPNETDIMMVNDAPLTSLYHELKPKYMCFADSYYLKKSKKVLELRNELKKTRRKLTIFYPHTMKKWNKFSGKNIESRYVFVPSGPARCDMFSYKLLKKNLMVPQFSNVAIMTIYIGIQLGYKKIFLYGADEDFMKDLSVDVDNRVLRKDIHYYGSEEFCTNFVHGMDMEAMMRMAYVTFAGFKILQQYAKKESVKIVNMSDSSWIDCFIRY